MKSDSNPMDADGVSARTVRSSKPPLAEPGRLPHFERPYDWNQIDETVRTTGGVILEALLSKEEADSLDHELDVYLEAHAEAGPPATGSDVYDVFLGHRTLRLHALVEKARSSADLIGGDELVGWAERLIGPRASSVLLNAGELIQIQPGEPAQFLHRDSDSWPEVEVRADPVIVNALVALDDCTLENGATYVAPESWQWDRDRQPEKHEFARAEMKRGDAVLFRGDLVHGGGENKSNARRRVVSISYCAGWLRPVENSFLNVSRETASQLTPKLQAVLGYAAHDATQQRGGIIGLYENGDPAQVLAVLDEGI